MNKEKNNMKSMDFPNQEIKYQQVVEEMKQLIPCLSDEMKSCPTEDLSFSLMETVDFYSLKRNFKFKSKFSNNDDITKEFKKKFLTNLSMFDTFIVVPTDNKNSLFIEAKSNKGNKFISPKVYDINGDEGFIPSVSEEIYLFLYDNIGDLNLFTKKNQNVNLTCFCLGINMNFFETKKWIKNNGLLEKNNFSFYFITSKSAKDTNLKYYNLPRKVIINSDNEILEDKNIKNLSDFDLTKKSMNNFNDINTNDIRGDTSFIFLENDNKRKIVKAINIYLKSADLKDVHFYVKSKISINKNGIKKSRCYPAFYGEATISEKGMIDNLANTLNSQELFNDVQNKVNFE
jgi:hypothetical protein